MYMQDKLNNARKIVYTIGLVAVALIVAWRLAIR
jgi:hypothetical protein